MKLEKHLIKLNEKFSNKEEAIRFCGKVLYESGFVTEDYIEAMINRDEELSVYMGNFIAIPMGLMKLKRLSLSLVSQSFKYQKELILAMQTIQK